MNIFQGYKSEGGAIVFSGFTMLPMLVLPKKYFIPYIAVAIMAMRRVAQGAVNKQRPPQQSCVTNPEGFNFVMSKNMSKERRPVALVTGTNGGIGFYTAVGLAAEGYIVVCTCRSAKLTLETAEKIKAEAEKRREKDPERFKDAPTPVTVDGSFFLECDNFDQIRSVTERFKETYGRSNFQVLVNNAGFVRKTLDFSKYNSNLELHTAVNALGPLLLTELLLPLLEKNDGRVVYVSSEAHRYVDSVIKDITGRSLAAGEEQGGKLFKALVDLNQGAAQAAGPLATNTTWKAVVRYGTSKLLNIYHAHNIARRYANAPAGMGKRVYACSLHPGVVATNFAADLLGNNWLSETLQYIGLLWAKSSEDGAQTTLHCAMCPPAELALVESKLKKKEQGNVSSDMSTAVAPYFVECKNNTHHLLRSNGWDIKEMECIMEWEKKLVGLKS